MAAFAEQQDVHFPSATVREALEFSAALRLDSSQTTATQVSELIQSTLDVLELGSIAGRMVSSLAPSEMKRLTIGVELCANPSILFLDEPTTGLDARSAHVVVAAIRAIASTGRTVVCTVHQPSTEVFFAFDHLLLLAPGGYVVYEGELGTRAQKLVSYFQAVPGVKRLPANTNPASWMLDVLYKTADPDVQPGSESPKDHNHNTPPRFARLYVDSELSRSLSTNVDASLDPATFPSQNEAVSSAASQSYGANFFVQVGYIGLRHWRETLRLRDFMSIRFFITIFLALFFGLIWLGSATSPTNQAEAYTALGVMVSTGVFLAITTFATTAPVFAEQRSVFYREKAASYYLPEAYAFSLLWVDIPWLALLVLVFMVCAAYIASSSQSS